MTDLIKREDAIRVLTEALFDEPPYLNSIEKCTAFAEKILKDIPAVEPMPEYIDNILIARHYANGMVAMNEECYQRLQKTVEPKQSEWIPCSERLPEENGKSYLTFQCGDDIKYGWCQVLRYDDGWNCFKGDKENEIKCVVAWMPLPEPWEGADDE